MIGKEKCWLAGKVKTDSILDPVSSLSPKFEFHCVLALQINGTQSYLSLRAECFMNTCHDWEEIFPSTYSMMSFVTINMRCFGYCKVRGTDVGVQTSLWCTYLTPKSSHLPRIYPGLVPGHGIKRVIQQGNKEGNRCCMVERSHTYSTCLLSKCAYWSGSLTSSVCSLCFAIRAIKTGPRSLWKASFFFPRGKSNSHRHNKETL